MLKRLVEEADEARIGAGGGRRCGGGFRGDGLERSFDEIGNGVGQRILGGRGLGHRTERVDLDAPIRRAGIDPVFEFPAARCVECSLVRAFAAGHFAGNPPEHFLPHGGHGELGLLALHEEEGRAIRNEHESLGAALDHEFQECVDDWHDVCAVEEPARHCGRTPPQAPFVCRDGG